MNRQRLTRVLLAVTGVIVLGLIAFFLFRPHPGSGSSAGNQGGRKILYWRDPMDPSMVSDKPGKSPMGMEMVPVYEGEDSGGVRIDPTTLQNIGVRYERAQVRTLQRNIRTDGKVTYDEQKLFYVNSKISGWVEKLYANYTGEFVRQGQPLMEVYSPDLVSAEEEYIIAVKARRADSSRSGGKAPEGNDLYERAHRKLMFWDISHEQIMRLERTMTPEKTMALTAPSTGVIVEKNVLQGGSIAAGTNLFKIADLSTVWITADIYEYEVPFVRTGQHATARLSYEPGKVYHGKVSYIYPYVTPETRTVRVRIELPNRDGALKPNMFATVEIESPVSVKSVTVPEQAVIHSGERNVVVISRGGGRFESRDVQLGVLANGYYQVIAGVQAGDSVVVSSQFLIDSESNLQAALQQMGPGSLPPDTTSMKQQMPGQQRAMPNMEGMEGMGETDSSMKSAAGDHSGHEK